MKTFDDIIEYVKGTYPELGAKSGLKLCMRIAVDQALDEVKQRIDGLDSLEPVSDCIAYINEIKDQLK